MSEELAANFLIKELDLTHKTVVDTWKVYMTWFTFFFTANLTVMSWVFVEAQQIQGSDTIWVLCFFWIVFNIFGTSSSTWLAVFSYQSNKRMEEILKRLGDIAPLVENKAAFPLQLSVIGSTFNGLSLIANILVWIYVWVEFGKPA